MNVQGVENIYTMTPLQQGLLFHSLLMPEAGLYVDQFVLDLAGDLSVPTLESAWQQVVNRHAILRTSFHWENLGKPLQVVHREVNMSVQTHDWRGRAPEVQAELLEAYLIADRQQGFDLSEPPLMRLASIQMMDDAYRFIWSFHHVILDGWSSSIVQAEVFALYEALSRGEELALEAVTPFSDYISWLRRQDLAAAADFWRQKLAGFTSTNSLNFGESPAGSSQPPTDRMEQEISLTSELTTALQSFARQHQITLNTIFLGAWGLLLNRYTGEQDIVVGVTVSGRPEALPGIESIVGNFINTLPARIQVYPGELVSWLKELQIAQAELHNYEYTPLVEIQKWRAVTDGKQLFESIFVFENAAPIGSTPEDVDGSVRITGSRHLFKTSYPLTVQVSPGEELAIRIEYDSGRFTPETVIRLLGHLETLLRNFVAAFNHPISTLSLMPEEATRQILWEWNDTRAAYPDSSTIHELFEAQARKTPDSVALIFEDEKLTFGQLNRKANRLAHWLRRSGVGPEVLVGVCMDRCLDLVTGILGILKAGGVCVPLDPSYPKDRLAFMLRDTCAPVVLTQARVAERLSELDEHIRIINLDAAAGTLAHESTDDPVNSSLADNLAYVIYTSGSTGVPKGVEICHRGIVRLLFGQNYVHLSSAETLLQLSPLSFDASFFEMWGALLHGGRCVLLPGNGLSTVELGRTLEKHRVSVLWLTASLFNSIVDTDAKVLSGVSQLLTGGEQLSVAHVDRAYDCLTATQIINGYGPTENTTFTCCYRIPRRPPGMGPDSIPIGRPIANTQTYLLDGQLNPVPVGVTGELYAGGDGLARGYLRRPELTAAHFLPHPFSDKSGARLYRTGDVARYLPDGKIEFLGRRDEQVKVRGYRIELGEIEAIMREHPNVREAVAQAQETAAGDLRLVAYVVAEAECALAATELRAFLKERLPEFMLPSTFVRLDGLPLSPNGKIDRQALAERGGDVLSGGESSVAPRTLVEELLAEIWAAVLDVEKVGIHDDFFRCGGHSLLAIQLISRIREAFQVELPVRSLFESPTIAELTGEIEQSLGREQNLQSLPLQRASREDNLALSFAQQRLWIIDQFDPGLPVYNIPLAVALKGPLCIAALVDSLNEIVRRHEALRTSFEARNGVPVQVIAPPSSVPLQFVDLTGLPQPEREAEALRLTTKEGLRQFDLSRGPLLRTHLFRLDEEEHILLLTMHHIISDGWSLDVLMGEVATLYQDFSAGAAPSLPELPIQYADYASWHREWLQGEALESQLAYWREQLAGAAGGLDLPSARSRPTLQTFNGGRLTSELPAHLYAALKTLSRNEHATLFMTLLAGFKSLLHRYTGEDDLLVGTVVAGRNRVETEKLIGFFVNTLVLRTDFSGDPSFHDALSRVREVALGAYAHQDVPFEKVVEELQPERNLSLSPLFQVLFTFQHAPASRLEIPGLSMSFMEVDTGSAKFDLYLSMTESEQGLSGMLEYNRDLFDDAAMRRLLAHFHLLLEGVAAAPDLPISQRPLLLPEEKELLTEWNNTQADFPDDLCLHELFEIQAERTPEAVALVCGDRRLTYQELEARANQLAHYLRHLGVGPESIVGVFISRSPELVIGLLAILKAGGAYLPLDPAYPKERMAFMLADVNARVLLTQEHLLESLPANSATVVFMMPNGGKYAEESTSRPTRAARPENLAYLIYTSGSTGRPKGIAIEHRNAVTFLHWARGIYSSVELSGVLATTSICFDISVFELFAPLSWGGKVILVENALALLNLNQTETITLVDIVPSAMVEVLRATKLPKSVRTVNLPGEPIPATLVEEIYRQKNVERVFNLYGPSEDTTYSTYALAERGSHKPPPAGRPIANTQLYLLDKKMSQVPLGAAGEVHIGGEGLSRGYYDRSDLTAERFIPNLYSTEPGARLYRTGDLARYLTDGQIEVLGRIDHQVKVRGFRIELGEIEAALNGHEAVRDAVVLAREDTPNDKRIVAYVVTQSPPPSTDELQSFLREKLPEYMLPSAFVMLDALPFLPNGKTDRARLPPPENLRPELQANYAAPGDELETTIASIWQEVLGLQKVGVHDNFFSDLGGHSLLVVQVVTKLREGLYPQLSFVDMFQFPTVYSLAEHLRSGADWFPSSEQAEERTQLRRQAMRQRRQFKQARLSVGTD